MSPEAVRTTEWLREARTLERQARSLLGLPEWTLGQSEESRICSIQILNREARRRERGRDVHPEARRLVERMTALDWQAVMQWDGLARGEARRHPLQLDDALQVYRSALYKAAIGFNPDAGFAFSTYAQWKLRAARNDPDLTDSAVQLPPNVRSIARRALVTDEEHLHSNVSKSQVDAARMALVPALQLDAPSDEAQEGKLRIGDLLVDPQPLPDSRLEAGMESGRVRNAAWRYVRHLDAVQSTKRRVCVAYFGLDGREPMGNYQDIARLLSVSRERVRQIVQDAISAIRGEIAGIPGSIEEPEISPEALAVIRTMPPDYQRLIQMVQRRRLLRHVVRLIAACWNTTNDDLRRAAPGAHGLYLSQARAALGVHLGAGHEPARTGRAWVDPVRWRMTTSIIGASPELPEGVPTSPPDRSTCLRRSAAGISYADS